MTSAMKAFLLIMGFLSAAFILGQFVLAMVIIQGGGQKIRTSHQHTGYVTVVVTLLYVAVSVWAIMGIPAKDKKGQ